MQDFLDATLWGRSAGRWLSALAFVAGGYLAGRLVSLLSTKLLRRAAERTKNRVDDIVIAVAQKPLVFVLVLLGLHLGVDRLALEGGAALWSDRVFYVLAVFAGAWTLSRVIDSIMEEYLVPLAAKTESTLDDQLLPILRKAARALIWIAALLVAVQNAGYDVGALLAGLGIGGVAVALAAKDTLSNLFGSVTVFIDRPFSVNDRVKVGGFDGTVTEIGIRSSRLRTLDDRVVTIPNSIFAASPIENVSSEPHTKVAAVLELALDRGAAGIEAALEALRGAAAATEGLDEGTIAALSGFGEARARVSFIVFVRKGADYFGTLSALNLEVLRRFAQAGVEFARPAPVFKTPS